MTKIEAHRLLDAARNGAQVSKAAITTALRVTGDAIGIPRDIDDDNDCDPVVHIVRPSGTWERNARVPQLRPAQFFDGSAL